jgi:hypothetical protein
MSVLFVMSSVLRSDGKGGGAGIWGKVVVVAVVSIDGSVDWSDMTGV